MNTRTQYSAYISECYANKDYPMSYRHFEQCKRFINRENVATLSPRSRHAQPQHRTQPQHVRA